MAADCTIGQIPPAAANQKRQSMFSEQFLKHALPFLICSSRGNLADSTIRGHSMPRMARPVARPWYYAGTEGTNPGESASGNVLHQCFHLMGQLVAQYIQCIHQGRDLVAFCRCRHAPARSTRAITQKRQPKLPFSYRIGLLFTDQLRFPPEDLSGPEIR